MVSNKTFRVFRGLFFLWQFFNDSFGILLPKPCAFRLSPSPSAAVGTNTHYNIPPAFAKSILTRRILMTLPPASRRGLTGKVSGTACRRSRIIAGSEGSPTEQTVNFGGPQPRPLRKGRSARPRWVEPSADSAGPEVPTRDRFSSVCRRK